MSTIKVTSMPNSGVLDGTERVPIVQGGVTKQTTTLEIAGLYSGGGSGTVTSVNLTAPSFISVGGVPITSSGTIALSLVSQTANKVFAGPASGGSAAPSFRALVADDLPTVPATKGGTGLTAYTTGDIIYASSSTSMARLAGVATGNALLSGGVGSAPSWGKIDLTTTVTGILPVANGGTGASSLGTLSRTNDTNVTLTLGGTPANSMLQSVSITAGWSGQLSIARGGTGQATASAAFDALAPTTTRGDLIFRNATTNTRLAASTSGYLLQTNGAGTDPTWSGFLQAGTGATTRTWQAKGRDFVSVQDFGAVGNGTTNDTAAIQAAIDYARAQSGNVFPSDHGGIVYFPAGYYLTNTLTLPSGVTLQGSGRWSTILKKADPNAATYVIQTEGYDDLATKDVTVNVTGLNTVTRTSGVWTADDDGKTIIITGAGTAGADYTGTLSGYSSGSPTVMTVSPATASNPSGASAQYGTDAWYVSTEGVPYGFNILDLQIDGSAYGPSSYETDRGGIRIYGKGYRTNVVIRNINGVGLWTECGSQVGQLTAEDMPETLNIVEVYRAGGHGIVNRGPHDSEWTYVMVSTCGVAATPGDGNGSGYIGQFALGLYAGHGEIGKAHIYACADPVTWDRRHKVNILICENHYGEGLVITSDDHSSIAQLEVYTNNHSYGTEQIRIETSKTTIGTISGTTSSSDTGSVADLIKVTGDHVNVDQIEYTGALTHKGIVNNGNFNRFSGFLRNVNVGVEQASGKTDNWYSLQIRVFNTAFDALGTYNRTYLDLDCVNTGAANLWGTTAPTALTTAQWSSCSFNVRANINSTATNYKGAETFELGNASDTTLARASAGDMSIEGNIVYRAGGTDVPVSDGGTGRSTGTTAYALIATGTTATGAQQTLASGATTEILVGGGASALPVWTTATGSGAPVRATSPTLVTPLLGTPTSGTLTNCTGLPQAGTVGLTTADSPQFAGVNVGNASDTTVTRLAAGVIAVEGAGINRGWSTGVANSITGTLTETVMATISLPAGAMGPNGELRITHSWGRSGTAAAITVNVRIGATGAGTGGTLMQAASVTTTAVSSRFDYVIWNANDASVQGGALNNGSLTVATAAFGSAAINTGNAFDIVISATLGNTGDTAQFKHASVTAIYGA